PPYYPRFEVRRVLEEPVPPLKPAHEAPPHLIDLVMRMLARRAVLRPRSMRDVIEELEATLNDTLALEEEPATRRPATPAPVSRPPSGLSPLDAEISPPPPAGASPPRTGISSGVEPPPVRARSGTLPPTPGPERMYAQGRSNQPAAPVAPAMPVSEPSFSRGAPPPVSWDDLDIQPVVRANLQRYRPMKPRRWPLFVLAALALLAFGVFWALPRYAPDWLERVIPPVAEVPARVADVLESASTSPPATEPRPASQDNSELVRKLAESRATFEKRLTALEARGAGTWGGEDFALARTRAAESVGAEDAGSP